MWRIGQQLLPMIDWSTSRICGSSDFISKLLSSKVKWWPDEATGGHGHHLSRIILSICYWFCTGKKYVLCCGFGLKQSSFKVQWWTVVSLALCIVVLAELINNNLSAAAAGRCFVLRCDAEIGIIKEILIIEGIMAATMLWIWGECRDVFRLNVVLASHNPTPTFLFLAINPSPLSQVSWPLHFIIQNFCHSIHLSYQYKSWERPCRCIVGPGEPSKVTLKS